MRHGLHAHIPRTRALYTVRFATLATSTKHATVVQPCKGPGTNTRAAGDAIMSKLDIPPRFKKCTAFIRRAEDLDKDVTRAESKVMAYYIRLYAMELVMELRDDS